MIFISFCDCLGHLLTTKLAFFLKQRLLLQSKPFGQADTYQSQYIVLAFKTHSPNIHPNEHTNLI